MQEKSGTNGKANGKVRDTDRNSDRSITVLIGSQTSPSRPSDKRNILSKHVRMVKVVA
jgi:hypothetical protein